MKIITKTRTVEMNCYRLRIAGGVNFANDHP